MSTIGGGRRTDAVVGVIVCAMQSVSPRVRALVAAVLCVVIALGAAFAVDSRLDRHWILRGLTLFLALCCCALLLTDRVGSSGWSSGPSAC